MYQAKPQRQEYFAKLLADARVQKALAFIEADQPRCVEELKQLVVIEAPSWQEEERAKAFAKLLQSQGLEDVHIAEGGNVVSLRKGSEPAENKKVVIDGHMDTVFPFGTVKGVEEKDGVLYAPGIGDDTRALTMLLCIDRALTAAGLTTKKNVLFVGTTREEGMGGLGGIHDLLVSRDDISNTSHLDNHNMASICYQATRGETWEFIIHGKAGHSYGAFGTMSNAIHAGARAIMKFAEMPVPEDPRTTYCTSNFHAGTAAGVHAFAEEASIKVNFRSNSLEEFQKMKEQIFRAFEEAGAEENAYWGKDTLTYEVKLINDTPGGLQPDDAPMVEAAALAIDACGVTPVLGKGGSTNANIAIGRGIPAVCLGRGYVPEGESGNIRNHSVDEFFPLHNAFKAIQSAFLVLLATAGVEGLCDPME